MCVKGRFEAQIDPKHKILTLPPLVHESRAKSVYIAGNPFGHRVQIHANCICNELSSLKGRHLVDRSYIPLDIKLVKRVHLLTTKLRYYPVDLKKTNFETIIQGYSGKKRLVYRRAAESLTISQLGPKDWRVKMFIKPDRFPYDVAKDKPPRAIQYRSPRYNLKLGCYIKAYEHALYPTLKMGVVSDTRIIAKGLNNYQRAALLLEKSSCFGRPAYVLLDHSKFDSCISVAHLEATHKKYQRAFGSRGLAALLRKQLHNRGITKNGIRYQTTGTRMSGDADTACGNTIVNADCLWGFLWFSGIEKYDILLDGDDSIVFVEQDDLWRLRYDYFEKFGFETKHEVVLNIHKAEFCQARLVLTDPPVMSRHPQRVLSHYCMSRKEYPNGKYKDLLAGIGLCELSTHQGVPVIQPFAMQLLKLSDTPFVDEQWSWWMESVQKRHTGLPITDIARQSFSEAFDIDITTQTLLEQYDYTANAYVVTESKVRRTRERTFGITRSSTRNFKVRKKNCHINVSYQQEIPILRRKHLKEYEWAATASRRVFMVQCTMDESRSGSWWCGS